MVVLFLSLSLWYCFELQGFSSLVRTATGLLQQLSIGKGKPVTGAAVCVSPERYCASADGAATGVAGTFVDTFCGNDGTVTPGNLLPGKYVIKVFKGTGC